MNRTTIFWYALAAVVVFGPVGLRMYFWPKSQAQVLNVADVAQGKMLFVHEWTVNDPLAGGDGVGPVFNATSCVACHNQGGVGGGGPLENNVTTFIDQRGRKIRQGVIHTRAVDPRYQETLAYIDPNLPPISQPTLESILPERVQDAIVVPGGCQVVVEQERARAKGPGKLDIPPGVHISQRNTPALFGAKLIDELPDSVIIAQERSQKLRWGATDSETAPVGRAMRHKDGRIGKFGWKAQSVSLIDFVEAACANELGLSNPGQAQPTPLGVSSYKSTGFDLTTKQCQQIASFIASLPQPVQQVPDNSRDLERQKNGEQLFHSIRCVECHVPDIGSIKGIYSDLLMHKMGRELQGLGGYNAPPSQPDAPDGTTPDEWRTPPLWGVADSAPYLHDGRAATLDQAIEMHGGQAKQSAQWFRELNGRARNDLIFFLKSLRAPRS